MGKPSNETVRMSQNPVVRKPGDATPPSPPRPADPNRKTVTVDLIERGIDWAIAENTRQGSKFFGKLDTSKVAVMGMSCGGIVALGAGTDPRVSAVGIWNSGSAMIPGEKDTASENLKKLHTPILY
jgi:dienelactone hydrolase